MFTQRREVEPVRNCAEIRPESRLRTGGLHHITGDSGNVDLRAIGPRVLPQRPKIAQWALNSPLVRLGHFDRSRLIGGFSAPSRRDTGHQFAGNLALLLARIGMDHTLVGPPTESIYWSPVERAKSNLTCRLFGPELGVGFERRQPYRGWI